MSAHECGLCEWPGTIVCKVPGTKTEGWMCDDHAEQFSAWAYFCEAIAWRWVRWRWSRCRCRDDNRCCGVSGHRHHVTPHRGCFLR